LLVTALPALGNLGFGALVFGQAISQQPFSAAMIAVGFVQWIILVATAWIIAGVDE
jgi:hypothetical protein